MNQEVEQAAQTVWSTVLGLPLELTEKDMARKATVMTGSIHITGGFDGAVLVELPSGMAQIAASKMFDMPAEEVEDDLSRDALAELTNMIGGQIKAMVPGPSKLSLPQVITGDRYQISTVGSETLCEVHLTCQDHTVAVTLLRREEEQSSA